MLKFQIHFVNHLMTSDGKWTFSENDLLFLLSGLFLNQFVCVYIYIYIYIHTHTHTYTHTHTRTHTHTHTHTESNFLQLYRPWMFKYTHLCVKMLIFAALKMLIRAALKVTAVQYSNCLSFILIKQQNIPLNHFRNFIRRNMYFIYTVKNTQCFIHLITLYNVCSISYLFVLL